MGWNSSNGKDRQMVPKKANGIISKSLVRWLIVGCFMTAGIGGAVYWMTSGEGSENESAAVKAKAVKRAKPMVVSAKTNAIPNVVTNGAPSVTPPSPPPFKKRPGAMQLPDGRVLTFKPPKEGEFKIVHSHGLKFRCDHLGNWEDITPKPIFDNAFEEGLVGVATHGGFIPGVLMGLDYDYVIKMLTKPVEINPDDSDEVVEKKQAVAEAKAAILDYMKDGASFDQFVMDMRRQVVKERAIKGMALKEIVGLLKAGRTEAAADMRDAADQLMERETGGWLTLPAHIESSLEGR